MVTDAKAYRSLNRTILLLMVCGLAACLLLLCLRPWLPHNLLTCASIRFLGIPCPLCGVTRGLVAIFTGHLDEASRLNVLTPPIVALIAAEFIGRGLAAVIPVPARLLQRIVRTDAAMHATLAGLYLVYSVWYYVRAF